MPRVCRRCAAPTADARNWYCLPCREVIAGDWREQGHRCANPSRTVPHWNCKACDKIKYANIRAGARAAAVTRAKRYPHRARPANAEQFWQRKAMSMVAAAKKFGLLPQLDGTIACVSCGEPARIYEHRDYSRPLDVEPVCCRCNINRGTAAVWPSADQFNFRKVGS